MSLSLSASLVIICARPVSNVFHRHIGLVSDVISCAKPHPNYLT